MTRNIRIVPDSHTLLAVPYQSAHEEYDVLVLPGGGPGAKTFCATDAVLELISAAPQESIHCLSSANPSW